MDKTLLLNEKTLKRIPPFFTLIFILLLGLPAIMLNYVGIDFSSMSQDITISNNFGVYIAEHQILNYFIQVILQWSAFSLAAITTLLALTQYLSLIHI